jgi:hypothetical protein
MAVRFLIGMLKEKIDCWRGVYCRQHNEYLLSLSQSTALREVAL